MKIAGIIRESIVDGPGFRYVIFTQGCPHACPGCHNPETHDFAGGYEKSVEEILAEIDKDPLLDGVTLSGGEPFSQPVELVKLAEGVKSRGLNILSYSGWTLEQLQHMSAAGPGIGAEPGPAHSVDPSAAGPGTGAEPGPAHSVDPSAAGPGTGDACAAAGEISVPIAEAGDCEPESVDTYAAAVGRLLELCDYLVDGPFILAERDLELHFRGSRNQRFIDMNKYRETGDVNASLAE